jgi:hypothetical protein
MCSQQPDDSLSLFEGVDDVVVKFLDVKNYRHQPPEEWNWSPPSSFDGVAMVNEMFEVVSTNWNLSLARLPPVLSRPPSKENWRWFVPKLDYSDGHFSGKRKSFEVPLEREIIRASVDRRKGDWSNQIPVASGIIKARGKKRAIDLVHKRGEAAFDLIELKDKSNHPLHGAIEIIEYGLTWLLSRRDRERLRYTKEWMKPSADLIEATDICLAVLATREFYGDTDLSWLASGLDAGIYELGKRIGGVKMGFAFTQFPSGFSVSRAVSRSPSDKYTCEELCALVDGRVRR